MKASTRSVAKGMKEVKENKGGKNANCAGTEIVSEHFSSLSVNVICDERGGPTMSRDAPENKRNARSDLYLEIYLIVENNFLMKNKAAPKVRLLSQVQS